MKAKTELTDEQKAKLALLEEKVEQLQRLAQNLDTFVAVCSGGKYKSDPEFLSRLNGTIKRIQDEQNKTRITG